MRIRVTRSFRIDVEGVGPMAFARGQRIDVAAMPAGHTAAKWVEHGLAEWPRWWSILAVVVLADGAGLPREGLNA